MRGLQGQSKLVRSCLRAGAGLPPFMEAVLPFSEAVLPLTEDLLPCIEAVLPFVKAVLHQLCSAFGGMMMGLLGWPACLATLPWMPLISMRRCH